MTDWETEGFDLDAYRARIRDDGPLDPTAATLRRLHRAHVLAIPFENLDVVLGRGVSLELADVQRKLVGARRGGYCFEHNLLFAAALERAGFGVDRLLARVRLDAEPGAIRSLTHTLLRVRFERGDWLADTGFGFNGLLEPVPLSDGISVQPGGWTYRVRHEHGDAWGLDIRRADGWAALYGFTLAPTHHVDWRMGNHYTATSDRSPFTARPFASRNVGDLRHRLMGDRLSELHPDGVRDGDRIDPARLGATLRDTFGIELDEHAVEGLRAALG